MNKSRRISFLFLVIFLITLSILIFYLIKTTAKHEAINTVKEFYREEQKGNFGTSYDLFHSSMHQHFTKDQYIQKRAHVFMQDFGTKSFDFTIGDVVHLKEWSYNKEESPIKDVFQISISLTFHSVFGVFSLEQDVYVAKQKNEWRILWEYE
ncbi:hypothetical protein [Terrilactibacillus laevilacticus]|uniref:DUF4829 domain-containing protein n=1 Tax=Terrilactibacillus laevilacticus TaxID=1380157 RepID=A0ABW5PSI5_9BACI|nr:hypothetical protein [Terrilactibacillus laevilacticus]